MFFHKKKFLHFQKKSIKIMNVWEQGDKLNKYLKKNLHYNSLPPKNNEVRSLTVTKL